MSNPLPKPFPFKAGCAQIDITPPIGTSLAGYFHDRVAKRVRDPLFAKALVVGNSQVKIAIISCDLCTMTDEVTNLARHAIQKECGIPPRHVMTCATHTHTGPELRKKRITPIVPLNEEWVETLCLARWPMQSR